jgi:hypothetical protein
VEDRKWDGRIKLIIRKLVSMVGFVLDGSRLGSSVVFLVC